MDGTLPRDYLSSVRGNNVVRYRIKSENDYNSYASKIRKESEMKCQIQKKLQLH